MADTTSVAGLADLQKLLDTLPAKVEANIMRGAMRAGAKIVADAAKAHVAVQSGTLRDSITIKTKKKGATVEATVQAGGKTKAGGDAFYPHMVEFGTDPHLIEAAEGGYLNINGTLLKSVMHPGAQAKPFMRPALDGNSSAAVVAVGEYVKKRLATKEGIDTAHIMVEGDE